MSFPEQLAHGDLIEVLPNVYFLTGKIIMGAGDNALHASRNMVVLKHEDAITLVNTVRVDEETLGQIEALGRVDSIVRLGAYHGRDDAFYLDRYSESKFWASSKWELNRGEEVAIEISDGAAGPVPNSEFFVFGTASLPEAIIRLGGRDGTLITCDSLQNWIGPDEYFDEASALKMRSAGFFHPANVGPGWLNATNPAQSDFNRLFEREFENVLSAHGVPLFGGAKAQYEATVSKIFVEK